MAEMFFEDVDGQPVPHKETAHGVTVVPDGKRFFTLDQAVEHFKKFSVDELRGLWDRTFAAREGEAEEQVIRRLFFPDLAIEHVRDIIMFCMKRGLNIWARHVWARLEPDPRGYPQLKIYPRIDGFWFIADRTGKCIGNPRPHYEYDADGKLKAVVVTVFKSVGGKKRRYEGIAHLSEYYPFHDPAARIHWDQRPHQMLEKCALAIALRRAFPDELGGMYTEEEMDQAKRPRTSPRPGDPDGSGGGEIPSGVPQSRMALHVALHTEFKINTEAKRNDVVAYFRHQYGHLGDSPLFWATVYRKVGDNPEAFGGQRPAAA